MALALTVSHDTPRDGALLDVTGLPATTASLTVTRVGPSGISAAVRGAVDAPASPGEWIGHDFELPLDVTLTYTVTAYNAAGAVVSTASAIFRIAYTACEAWLVDLGRALNSLQVVIESLAELDFAVPSGVYRVLNRRAPVVASLPAWTPTAELIVLTTTLDERDRVRDLLGSGYPFLLRTGPVQGIGNLYLAASEFVEERFLAPGDAPQRRFRVSVVQIERPDPSVFRPVAPNTYANVKATFATYADLLAGVANYDGLAYIFPTGEHPVSPWPPDDV